MAPGPGMQPRPGEEDLDALQLEARLAVTNVAVHALSPREFENCYSGRKPFRCQLDRHPGERPRLRREMADGGNVELHESQPTLGQGGYR